MPTILMNQGDKDSTSADQITNKVEMDSKRLIRAVVKRLIDEINIHRSQHSLSDRTIEQSKTAIRVEIDLV